MGKMNVNGPGSVELGLKVDLGELREALINADHPLAGAPQWNGDRVWLVGVYPDDDEVRPWVSVVKAKTKERAEEVAVANCRSRGGPQWTATAEEIEFGSKQLLASVRVLR